MTQQNIPKIYNIRTHNHMNQHFITCYFKIAYTMHTKTYKISASHTIKQFVQKMKQYIRNDLYLELLDVPNFEFVCADHYSIHGVASEQGPALVPTPSHTLDSLIGRDQHNISDDSYLAFYIRPCEEQNSVQNNT
jgi:hypothetical protein